MVLGFKRKKTSDLFKEKEKMAFQLESLHQAEIRGKAKAREDALKDSRKVRLAKSAGALFVDALFTPPSKPVRGRKKVRKRKRRGSLELYPRGKSVFLP